MLSLKDSVEKLRLMKPQNLKALSHLGIQTVIDLLYYFPRDWQDLSEIKTISQVQPNEKANLRATLKSLGENRSRWRRIHVLNALFQDKTGSIAAVWFNQPFVRYSLKPGREYYLSGKVYLKDTLQLQNPTYELVKDETIHTAGIVPVYELTEGVTGKQIRYWLNQLIDLCDRLPDVLPDEIRKKHGFFDLPSALRSIHFPKDYEDLEKSRARFAFEELFLFQLALLSFKSKLKQLPAPPIRFQAELIKKFVSSLPFSLTHSQRTAVWEILKDLQQPHPMNRLLQGEVGSGKTVVAGIAMLEAAHAGYQSVMLAPTEILAWQHYQTLKQLFRDANLEIALLTRSHKETHNSPSPSLTLREGTPPLKVRGGGEELLNRVSASQIKIVIGTHALLQEHVKFSKIGLLVIDEQHRFGVKQRSHLLGPNQHGLIPHLLSMTATPIPRTLALAFYGDLDISELRELPKGRKKIITRLVEPEKRPLAYEFIKKQILAGRQVYVVTPLIGETKNSEEFDLSPTLGAPLKSRSDFWGNPDLPSPGEKVTLSPLLSPSRGRGIEGEGVKAAITELEKLKKIFPEFQIGLLHGRLKGEEKKKIMEDFKAGEIHILVSTSVIEVGVDVPNASVMVIENAERFGLSQLHQLRGRVGRAEHQSYCLLFAENMSEYTKERLITVVNSNDGFELAEKDLELRGHGEIIGTKQSGFIPFRVAKLSDKKLIKLAKEEAQELLNADSSLSRFPLLKQKTDQIARGAHLE